MLQFFIIIVLLLLIVPILFVGGIIGTIWRMLKGNNSKGFDRNGYSSHTGGYGQSSSSYQQQSDNRGSSHSGQRQSSGGNHPKIFKENQGEYVEYEEID